MPNVTLIRVDVRRDENEYGELAWLVTPLYDHNGRPMTVPDDKGWPTEAEAIIEAGRIRDRRRK